MSLYWKITVELVETAIFMKGSEFHERLSAGQVANYPRHTERDGVDDESRIKVFSEFGICSVPTCNNFNLGCYKPLIIDL